MPQFKYQEIIPITPGESSASGSGVFASYGTQTIEQGYRVSAESPKPLPDSAFGFVAKEENLDMVACTFLGKRKAQEDRFSLGKTVNEVKQLSEVTKQEALREVINTLGDELLLNDDDKPCNGDIDDRMEECQAKGTGSTLVAVMSDTQGLTVGSTGDSFALALVVKPEGVVAMQILNGRHVLNAQALESGLDHIVYTPSGKPALSSDAVGHLSMARALGDIAHREDCGLIHEPDVRGLSYERIPGYDPAAGDKLFVMVASDGLFDNMGGHPAYQQQLKEIKAAYTTNLASKRITGIQAADQYENLNQEKYQYNIGAMQDRIQDRIKEAQGQRDPKEDQNRMIAHAILGELSQQTGHDLKKAIDNFTAVIWEAGPGTEPRCGAVFDGHAGVDAAQYLSEQFMTTLRAKLVVQLNAGAIHASKDVPGFPGRAPGSGSGRDETATPPLPLTPKK